jgi:hypothetical protein
MAKCFPQCLQRKYSVKLIPANLWGWMREVRTLVLLQWMQWGLALRIRA